MWLMLQQETPDDYVVATGEVHSVRELVEVAFAEVDIRIKWVMIKINQPPAALLTGKTKMNAEA